ncbi:hypothetical protein INT47_009238 [Mucor saturninus]|uniref:Uncharacterized protein n=1 Tax=Mucor saturninus TaxID=64648 RepID=A0A8H7UUM3_9FUNG|nr:hypothetical protein INT47_009238 [Mucor saturninus]
MSNQRRNIAPRPADDDVNMQTVITNLQEDLASIRGDMTTMNRRMGTLIESNLTVIAATSIVAPVPVLASVAAPTAEATNESMSDAKKRVFKDIREYLWQPKLRSRALVDIQANNNKPRWDVHTHFDESPNKELVERLLAYLGPNFVGSPLRRSDIREKVYRNFCSRRQEQRKSSEKKAVSNARSRRANREKDHFERRMTAFLKHKEAIEQAMGQVCSGLLQKEAMSEGESDNDTSKTLGKRRVSVYRPSWRSDEFNRFIEIVDSFVSLDLGMNAHQMLSRDLKGVRDLAVPGDLAARLPPWVIRN